MLGLFVGDSLYDFSFARSPLTKCGTTRSPPIKCGITGSTLVETMDDGSPPRSQLQLCTLQSQQRVTDCDALQPTRGSCVPFQLIDKEKPSHWRHPFNLVHFHAILNCHPPFWYFGCANFKCGGHDIVKYSWLPFLTYFHDFVSLCFMKNINSYKCENTARGNLEIKIWTSVNVWYLLQSVAYDALSAMMKLIPQKQARKVRKMSYVVLKLRIQRILFFYMCVFTGVAISHLQQTNTQTMQTCAE